MRACTSPKLLQDLVSIFYFTLSVHQLKYANGCTHSLPQLLHHNLTQMHHLLTCINSPYRLDKKAKHIARLSVYNISAISVPGAIVLW